MLQYICFGDSLTAGYGAAPQDGWIAVLSRRHPDMSWTNRGACGASLSHILDSLSSFPARSDKEKILFVMGGTNDILSGVRMTVLQSLVRSAVRRAGPDASRLVLGIPPLTLRSSILSGWQEEWQYEDTNRSLEEYGEFLRDTAASAGCPVINFQQAFLHASDALYDDGVHPNAAGYRLFAETAEPVLCPFPAKRKD